MKKKLNAILSVVAADPCVPALLLNKYPNTRIELMYRDACNWKTPLDVVVEGQLEREAIEPYLHEGEFLIPGDVGLPESDQGWMWQPM